MRAHWKPLEPALHRAASILVFESAETKGASAAELHIRMLNEGAPQVPKTDALAAIQRLLDKLGLQRPEQLASVTQADCLRNKDGNAAEAMALFALVVVVQAHLPSPPKQHFDITGLEMAFSEPGAEAELNGELSFRTDRKDDPRVLIRMDGKQVVVTLAKALPDAPEGHPKGRAQFCVQTFAGRPPELTGLLNVRRELARSGIGRRLAVRFEHDGEVFAKGEIERSCGRSFALVPGSLVTV